jgi:hypothetical protein
VNEGGEERIADADRQAMVERLRTHYADGRLDLAEFEERVAAAWAARTRRELEPLASDLPVLFAPTVAPKERAWLVSVLGGTRRSGRWRVGRRTNVVSILGETELDLRRAELPGGDLRLTVVSLVGGVRVVVPLGWDVELGGFSLGRRNVRLEAPRMDGAPVLRLRVWGLLSEVKARDGDRRDRRRRHRGPMPPLPPAPPGP